MPVDNRQLSSGAVTDSKVGKNAGIKGSKLEVAEPGQVLVADEKGRFRPKHVNFPDENEKCCCEDCVTGRDFPNGEVLVGGPDGVPVSKRIGEGPETVPVRDKDGKIPDLQIVDNHIPGVKVEDRASVVDPTVAPNYGSDGSDLNAFYVDRTAQRIPKQHLVYVTASTPGVTKAYEFKHNLGYIPDVLVLDKATQTELDTEVSVTTEKATVTLSDAGTQLMVVVQ